MSFKKISEVKIVPVVKVHSAEEGVNVVKALVAGGIPIAEITYRIAAAGEAISAAVQACPEALIGAGTVTKLSEAEDAVSRGAAFIVSPGYSDEVNDFCKKTGIDYIPGAVTPTEIMHAIDGGNKVIKFFPASVYGGVKALKALGAPFADITFIPTGGVSQENLADYLALPNVLAVGGSWMVKESLIAAGNYEEISNICKIAVEIAEGKL